MNTSDAKRILETALICAQQPMRLADMLVLFKDEIGADTLKVMLYELQQEWGLKGVEEAITAHARGVPWRVIAADLGISRDTLRRLTTAATPTRGFEIHAD